MATRRKNDRRGLGGAVRKHIYRYGKGKLEGFQPRLKRPGKGKDKKPESTSAYFSISKYGSQAAALAAAERWLRQNERWQRDRKFKPRKAAAKGSRKGHLRLVRPRGARKLQKHAKAA